MLQGPPGRPGLPGADGLAGPPGTMLMLPVSAQIYILVSLLSCNLSAGCFSAVFNDDIKENEPCVCLCL